MPLNSTKHSYCLLLRPTFKNSLLQAFSPIALVLTMTLNMSFAEDIQNPKPNFVDISRSGQIPYTHYTGSYLLRVSQNLRRKRHSSPHLQEKPQILHVNNSHFENLWKKPKFSHVKPHVIHKRLKTKGPLKYLQLSKFRHFKISSTNYSTSPPPYKTSDFKAWNTTNFLHTIRTRNHFPPDKYNEISKPLPTTKATFTSSPSGIPNQGRTRAKTSKSPYLHRTSGNSRPYLPKSDRYFVRRRRNARADTPLIGSPSSKGNPRLPLSKELLSLSSLFISSTLDIKGRDNLQGNRPTLTRPGQETTVNSRLQHSSMKLVDDKGKRRRGRRSSSTAITTNSPLSPHSNCRWELGCKIIALCVGHANERSLSDDGNCSQWFSQLKQNYGLSSSLIGSWGEMRMSSYIIYGKGQKGRGTTVVGLTCSARENGTTRGTRDKRAVVQLIIVCNEEDVNCTIKHLAKRLPETPITYDKASKDLYLSTCSIQAFPVDEKRFGWNRKFVGKLEQSPSSTDTLNSFGSIQNVGSSLFGSKKDNWVLGAKPQIKLSWKTHLNLRNVDSLVDFLETKKLEHPEQKKVDSSQKDQVTEGFSSSIFSHHEIPRRVKRAASSSSGQMDMNSVINSVRSRASTGYDDNITSTSTSGVNVNLTLTRNNLSGGAQMESETKVLHRKRDGIRFHRKHDLSVSLEMPTIDHKTRHHHLRNVLNKKSLDDDISLELSDSEQQLNYVHNTNYNCENFTNPTNTTTDMVIEGDNLSSALETNCSKVADLTEDELESLLILKFKASHPVALWSSFGLYDDSFLAQDVDPHWLQFEGAGPGVHGALALLYTLIMMIGCTGNALVICLILRCRPLRTPPNYLVGSLAVSDLLMMLKMPIFIVNSWYSGPVLGHIGCQVYGFVGGLSGSASIITLAAISLERYYVIVHPMNPFKKTTRRRACAMVLTVWLYALTFSIIPLLRLVNRYESEGYLTSCSFDYLSPLLRDRIFVFVFFLAAWFVPLTIICFSYTKIFFMVKVAEERMLNMGKDNHSSAASGRLSFRFSHKEKERAEIKVALLAGVLMLTWTVAWTPYAAVALIGISGHKAWLTPLMSAIPALFCKSAACLDPFLYAINHPKFRREIQNKVLRRTALSFRTSMSQGENTNNGNKKESRDNTMDNSLVTLNSENSTPLPTPKRTVVKFKGRQEQEWIPLERQKKAAVGNDVENDHHSNPELEKNCKVTSTSNTNFGETDAETTNSNSPTSQDKNDIHPTTRRYYKTTRI